MDTNSLPTLKGLTQKHPGVRLATKSESRKIAKFAKSIDMQASGLKIVYERKPDYFSYAKCQGEKTETVLFEEDDVIHGIGCLSLRKGMIQDKVHPIPYWTDLRMMPGKTSRRWRKFLEKIVGNFADVHQCYYHTTTILAQNHRAIKAVTTGLGPNLICEKIMDYQICQVLTPIFKIPIVALPNGFKLLSGDSLNMQAIIDFLHNQSKKKLFGHCYTDQEWENRSTKWPGFDVKNFLVVLNEKNEIVASTLPFDPSPVRNVCFVAMPWSLKGLSKISQIISSRFGVKAVKEGNTFTPLYLSHFELSQELNESERKLVFNALVAEVFLKSIKPNPNKFTGVSFFDDANSSLSGLLKGYITQSTPAQFYCIRHKNSPALPTELQAIHHFDEISFEMTFS